MTSKFQAGGALPANHVTYVERQADKTALRAALKGEYLHLIAPRQIGKTSLFKCLMHKLRKQGWRCAYIDSSTFTDLPKVKWYTRIGQALARELTPDFIPTLNDQIDLYNYLLDQALTWGNGQTDIAIFFDEVEGISKAKDVDGSSFSDTFFMTLRSLYLRRDEYKGNIVVALAGVTSTSNLVKDPDVSPFNVSVEVVLEDFSWPESLLLTMHLEDLSIPIEKAVHQEIYKWAGGQPYLTQYICATLEQYILYQDVNTSITPETVRELVWKTIVDKAATPHRNTNLGHIAKKLALLSSRSAELWTRLRLGSPVSANKVSDTLYQELYLTGAVKLQNNYLVIRNKIYQLVFAENMDSETVSAISNVPNHELNKLVPISSSISSKAQTKLTVYISYAPEDEALRKDLEKHLKILQQLGFIRVWHNRQISPGAEWEHEVEVHLNTAQIILLLVSPNFVASDYCYRVEMKKAMERQKRGEAFIIPILLRPTADWKRTPFGTLQALPRNEIPIINWSNHDEAFAEVAKGISEVVEKLTDANS